MKTAEDFFHEYRQPMLQGYLKAYHIEPKSPVALRKTTHRLRFDMWSEMEDIGKERHARRFGKKELQIAKEQNQKWNDICDLFEQKRGIAPLEKDHFLKEYMRLYQMNEGEAK